MWRDVCTPIVLRLEATESQLLAVSSALDGEGKTTVSLGLALAMAQDSEKNVLLLDGNPFRPSLSESLEIKDAVGLVDCLTRSTSLQAIARPTSLKNLWVVPSGPRVTRLSKLIRSSAMADLLQEARSKHNIVVMDTPSLLSCSDTRVMVSYSDAMVLVVRSGMSTTTTVAEALGLVDKVNHRWLVVNDYRSAVPMPVRRLLARIQ
ncbi:MAG: CpsD/CapB family tyrosine-protein kinase [Chloroflexi bacterium]|nr:CpsD/CapB family tyrosine-protein kinase [Chloroflexota bacterium]